MLAGGHLADTTRNTSAVSTLVQDTVDAILGRLDQAPRRIVLFGSEARGDANPDSDVDILVVADIADRRIVEEVRDATYRVMWDHDFDRLVSVVVMPTNEFEEQRRKGFSFIHNVEHEGIVLWPAA